MKKKLVLVSALVCTVALLAACGKDKAAESTSLFETVGNETETQQEVESAPEAQENAETETAPETESSQSALTEEQKNGETFNARDYLTATENKDDKAADNSSQAPVEYETADGFMASFLLASDKDKIDTTNDYGVLYRVIYEASLAGDELKACGSMDYRNSKDQDPITISSDVTHVFKVDEGTIYQKEGEEGTETLSKEDFAGLLDSRKDSGMYFEVEISGGIVKTATLSAQ